MENFFLILFKKEPIYWLGKIVRKKQLRAGKFDILVNYVSRFFPKCFLLLFPTGHERVVNLSVRQVSDVIEEGSTFDQESNDVQVTSNDAPMNGAHALVVGSVDFCTLLKCFSFAICVVINKKQDFNSIFILQ